MILGFWEIILVIIITLGNLFLGGIVIKHNPRASKNKVFCLLSLSVSSWILSAFISEIFPLTYPSISLICSKIAIASVTFAVFCFFYFSILSFSHLSRKKIKRFYYFGLCFTLLSIILIFLPKVIIKDLIIYPDGNFDILYTSLYHYFILPFIIILLIIALAISIKGYHSLSPIEQNRFHYFLLGVGTFVLFNIIFNIGVPFVIGTNIYYRIGNYSSIFLLGLTAYAILAKQLFNIKIAITEIAVGIISLLLFINILVSTSPWEYAWKSGLLLAFIIFGILLVKSVYKEIEYRKRLEIAYQKLKQLDKAKTEFLSIASHQLRTPLSILKGYLSMLLEGTYGKLPNKIYPVIQNLFNTNEQLIKLVNDLLNISRIEAGKISINKKEVDIEKFISSIVQEIQPEAQQKGLEVKYKNTCPIKKILLDPSKIQQVILNILDNAIKYTEKGRITIETTQQDSSLLIKIKDTGVGMTKEETQRIFESFRRGDAGQKMWTGGSGLGLYVAKKFVEMHNGKIWAESEGPGKGSTFYIELPIS